VLQIREHFNWFTWALAQFFFFFNGSSPHYQQFQNGAGAAGGASSTVTNSADNVPGSTNSSTAASAQGMRSFLPKVGAKAWSDGFEFKGVFIRVLPYEDAQFIRNEIKALRYTQLELLELKSLTKTSHFQRQLSTLHLELILPLLAAVSCGGFYLYATPIINLPKSTLMDARLEADFAHVRDLIVSPISPQSLNYSPSPQPPDNYDLNSPSVKGLSNLKRPFNLEENKQQRLRESDRITDDSLLK
jgi:hypothetical protein